jgi:hypothetical protein
VIGEQLVREPRLPRAGRIPGGRSYGYDVVPTDEDREQRMINQAEAEIIRRIFREYVDCSCALEIAGRLNRERIAAPRSPVERVYNQRSRKRLNRVTNNRLYIGKIVLQSAAVHQGPSKWAPPSAAEFAVRVAGTGCA